MIMILTGHHLSVAMEAFLELRTPKANQKLQYTYQTRREFNIVRVITFATTLVSDQANV